MVCEGPADRAILEAALDAYVDDYEPIAIQPPKGLLGGNAGPLGGGWRGVRAWCTSEVAGSNAGWRALLRNNDLVVIQVDADVAGEREIGREKPCPPASDSSDEVRALIRKRLSVDPLPEKVVLCVPSMASETWALVALLPNHKAVSASDPAPGKGDGRPCIECRTDIKALLTDRSKDIGAKLVTRKKGRLQNRESEYRKVQPQITSGWNAVVRRCGEA